MRVEAGIVADRDELFEVFTHARTSAMPWLPDLHTDAETRAFIAGHVLERCDVLVVRRDGRAAGFLALAGEWVEHLYVHPEAQGAGIGTALLEEAKRRRPGRLRLWVFQRNAAARRFYAARGFVELERTDGAGNEEREPDVLLGWPGQA